MKLVLFALFWAVLIYAVNCLISREFKRVDFRQAILYFLTVAMIGLFGEIFLDTIYNSVFGTPLWRYNILPIHNAYTSSYAIVTWGIYGFHLYLLHGTLKKRSMTKVWHLALIISLEALLAEAALTLSAKVYLGKYLYYYYPSGLWHVSAFQNMPFYFVFGIVVLKALNHFQTSPKFFSVLSAWLILIIVFLT